MPIFIYSIFFFFFFVFLENRYKHEVLVDGEPILFEILDTCPKVILLSMIKERFESSGFINKKKIKNTLSFCCSIYRARTSYPLRKLYNGRMDYF